MRGLYKKAALIVLMIQMQFWASMSQDLQKYVHNRQKILVSKSTLDSRGGKVRVEVISRSNWKEVLRRRLKVEDYLPVSKFKSFYYKLAKKKKSGLCSLSKHFSP